MNYFLTIVLLILCGALYFQQQKYTDAEKSITDKNAQIATLQEENQTLTNQNSALTASVKAAEAKITASASAPVQNQTGTPAPVTPGTPAAANPGTAAPPKLTSDQMAQAVVMIKGDNAEGTGFLVKMADGPVVVTNLHVLADNPNVKILTYNGVTITPTGMKGALDRDLAVLPIADGPYTYLPLATDVGATSHVGDDVITPGNSQGGGVVLDTHGKLLALGPDRIEFDNPIYHGNSGGPVFHAPSGTVLGVVTEAMQVSQTNDLDKTSFASRNSAITSKERYFGMRLDTVAKWEVYNPAQYQNETAFLDQFDKQSQRLDSYLNPDQNDNGAAAASDSDSKPYLSDEKIMAAHNTFRQDIDGADTSGRIDALRHLCFDLDSIASRDLATIQNLDNFYTFDQQRAKDELAYRKALQAEIQDFSNDVNRIGHLPHTNN